MSHPFFTVAKFPFNRPEAVALLSELKVTYATVVEIQAVFEDAAGDWGSIAANNPPYFVWRQVLTQLGCTGLLEGFCTRLLSKQPPLRLALVAALEAVVTATNEPRPKPVISDRLFILDRLDIDAKLALLADDNAPENVILIRGGKSSGKSHCRHLMQRRAEEAGADFIYLGAGKVADARETIDQLYSHFNSMSAIPALETTPNAWYKKVCLRLKELAATVEPEEKRRPLWIAMDDMGVDQQQRPILPEEVRQFFNQFALNMDNQGFSQWFRLMLINYPDDTPTEWQESSWTDNEAPIDEKDIQAQHVADCLQAWATENKRVINQDDLMTRAANLIQLVDTQPAGGAPPLPRLRRVHNELERIIKELKAQVV